MAQHDYNIANAAAATVRADINSALTAIATLNSGATAPATTFAYQWWFDTTNNLLKIRDGANASWVTVASLSGTTWTPYSGGAALGNAATKTIGTGLKATGSNLDLDITGLTAETAPATGDEVAIQDVSATAKRKMTLANLLAVVNALTETTAVDAANDFLLLYDSSASAARKVKPSNLGVFTESFTSAEQAIATGGSLTIAHGLTTTPYLIQPWLINKTAELGYAVGQETLAYLAEAAPGDSGLAIVPDATNVGVRFGTSVLLVNRWDTGAVASITAANWKLIIRAWA
jgi:hypothetical protein